jgi:phosphomannomutase
MPGRPPFQNQDIAFSGQVQREFPLERSRDSHYAGPVLRRLLSALERHGWKLSMHDPIKVYDARWEVSDFDDSQVTRLFEATLAYGRLLGVDTVVLTRDARLGCPRVLEIGINTALRLGFRVIACPDPISTPQGYFVALRTSARHPHTMGLAITASHNPAQYIGVKFTVPTVQAIGLDCGPLGGLAKVREIYHSAEQFAATGGGELHLIKHPTDEYVAYSLNAAGVRRGELTGLTVVLDAFHGSAGPEIWHALTAAGVRVLPLRWVPDGAFPTGSPNPTSQGKMDDAIRVADQSQADVVLGVDGDGDRTVFGDRRGILSAGFVTVPVLRTLIAAGELPQGAKVLYDPKVNPLALAEWGKLGVAPVLFRNGHSQIKDYMTRSGAVAGAEESGHYYHRLKYEGLTISGENSILTILLFLRAVQASPGLMDELWALQDQVFTTGEFNYQFPTDDIRDQALAAAIGDLEAEGAASQSATADGIDLEGTVVNRGVALGAAGVSLDDRWYSGYFRVATNEKGVVRSYLSTGDAAFGRQLERRIRDLLERTFAGKVIE